MGEEAGGLLMKEQLRDTIRRISEKHLKENNGLLLGQCLTAVGWVGNTIPRLSEKEGIVELSMDDTFASYMIAGVAAGDKTRPIYVVRYQGFQWFNAVGIMNYAAKSKEMWGVPCPVFVRSIAMEGGGRRGREERAIGPVASASHHGMIYRMPGISICAPATPKEYEQIWDHFMSHDDPMYVSEHRRVWDVDYEIEDIVEKDADLTLFPITATRLNAMEAVSRLKEDGVKCNLINILWLKPFELNKKDELIEHSLENSRCGGLVLDGDFVNGVAKNMAYDMMHKHQRPVYALGLEEKTSGFSPWNNNLSPTPDRIYSYARWLVEKNK